MQPAPGVPKDDAEATKYSRNGCDGGNMSSCINLAVHYYTGRGVTKDQPQAIALDAKACGGGEPFACTSMAPSNSW